MSKNPALYYLTIITKVGPTADLRPYPAAMTLDKALDEVTGWDQMTESTAAQTGHKDWSAVGLVCSTQILNADLKHYGDKRLNLVDHPNVVHVLTVPREGAVDEAAPPRVH